MTGPLAQPATRCALFLAAFLCVAPEAADASRHLYVSAFISGQSVVERIPLVSGLPVGKPDVVYSGYGEHIAVAGNGTLYTTPDTNTPVRVYAFAPGSSKPTRTIIIPNIARRCREIGATRVDSIATDAGGNLFAAIDNYFSGAARARQGFQVARSGVRAPCQGVAVYSPVAVGAAAPIQAISIQSQTMPGMTVDASDDLYVADSGRQDVEEFSNAVTDPTFVRTLESAYTFEVQSLANDASGNLFVYLTPWCRTCQGAAINVFSPSAVGNGAPESAILFGGMGHNSLSSIAVEAPYLYAANTLGSVDVYPALANGTQIPLFSVKIPNVSAVAVGP